MKMICSMFFLAMILTLQGGCSVGMAMSGEKDPDLTILKVGESRGAIELQLKKSLRERIDQKGYSYVTYEYTLGNDPSAGRAIGHGVMDVLTLGLWEVVGTPIEGSAANKEIHQVTVVYDRNESVVAINPTALFTKEEELEPLPFEDELELKEKDNSDE